MSGGDTRCRARDWICEYTAKNRLADARKKLWAYEPEENIETKERGQSPMACRRKWQEIVSGSRGQIWLNTLSVVLPVIRGEDTRDLF